MPLKRLTPRRRHSPGALSAWPFSRRALVGLPVLWALAGCVNTDPYLEEDDAVADALKSEPMWVSYRPAWVQSEVLRLGRRRGGDLAAESRVMQSHRFLHGDVPPDAVAAARAAAVQFGWPPPGSDLYQVRSAQGKGKSVLLSLFLTAIDGVLDIYISGSF